MDKKVVIKKSDFKYLVIGKIVTTLVFWGLGVAFIVWAFLQNTIY